MYKHVQAACASVACADMCSRANVWCVQTSASVCTSACGCASVCRRVLCKHVQTACATVAHADVYSRANVCGVCKRVQVCALVHVDVQVCVCRRVLCKHVQTACAAAARADVFADMCSHVQAFVCDVVKRVQTCVQVHVGVCVLMCVSEVFVQLRVLCARQERSVPRLGPRVQCPSWAPVGRAGPSWAPRPSVDGPTFPCASEGTGYAATGDPRAGPAEAERPRS